MLLSVSCPSTSIASKKQSVRATKRIFEPNKHITYNSSSAVLQEKKTNQISSLLTEAYKSRLNNLDQSIALAKDALSMSEQLGNKSFIAKSLNQLSLFYMITGEFEKSMSMAQEAIKYFEELKDETGVADSKYNIAGLYYKTDNFHRGLVYLIDCLSIYRKFEDYHNQAKVLKSIGTIYEFFGDNKSAINHYEDSIEAAKKSGDINIESNAYNPLSGIYLNQGKIDKALHLIEKSIQMKKESGDVRGLAFALYGRGKLYTKTKEFKKAEEDLRKSIDIHIKMGEKIGLGMSYHKFGFLYKEMGQTTKAKEMLKKALDFGQSHNIVLIKYKSNYLLYEIHKAEGDTIKALEYHEGYIKDKDVVINTQTFKMIESYEALRKMQTLQREAEIQREKEEIIEKKDLAEQASIMKEDFLSTMSHEIRTPLNAVITISSLLRNRSNKEEGQLLDSLEFSANNLMLIINDILDFTKLDSGKVDLDPRPCDLKGLIESIRNTYSSMAVEKGLSLNSYIDEKVSESYKLDEVKMSQILGNLISNAIKFTDKGHIDISVNKVGENKKKDKLRFEVSDTGIGIPCEEFEMIFDSFTQPKQLTTQAEGGSGLGLAIVKKLVSLHGSEITLESRLKKGSVFSFDITLSKSVVRSKPSSEQTDQLKGYKVLIADDMMINVMVATELLRTWGMTIDHAETGIEAIKKSKKIRYDFILMDIHMPEMDGYEATKQIRKSGNPNQETPIFALTADVTADQRQLYEPYFDEFMLKPIERDKLFQAFVNLSVSEKNQIAVNQ